MNLAQRGDLIVLVGVILVLVILPTQVSNNYQLSILVFIGLNTMLTLGLSLLMGYAGQISLGHAVFFGVGAYATGILTTRFEWSPWLAMVVAMVITAIVAYVIGVPIFRLRGHYLAMATLGLNIVFELFLISETDLTGGPNGLSGIPKPAIGDFVLKGDLTYYFLVWGMTVLVLVLSLNIVNSRVGRALHAIQISELAAETMGINTEKIKLQVLVLSAMYASLAGSLYVFYLSIISPSVVNIF
ncbi:MAG: branched-chain amino acid ABC transporter permease, partial [Chloroflexi bacterium RBG_16_57_9]